MSPIIRGNFRMAIASMRNARWRSAFTIFGVVVAIVPVLTILSIGEGVQRQINNQIKELGSNLITIRPGKLINDSNPLQQFNALSGYTTAGSLNEKDYLAIKDIKSLKETAPFSTIPGSVTLNDKTMRDTFVIGTTEDMPALINQSVQYGEFFKDKDYGRRTAVIGRGAAEKIFGEGVPLGRAFDFRDETFVVGGVLERFDVIPLSFNTDLNDAIIIPLPLANNIAGPTPIYQILVRPASEDVTSKAVKDIEAALTKSRGGEKDFSVVTQAENTRVVNRILTLLTALVSGVAGIALLVSGIGIMNIMLVSVTERMHEIGVRKAIGATKRQIVGQFMSEAIMLSVIGAILGVMLSYVVQYFIRLFSEIEPVITWQDALLVSGIALAVGVIFGSAPAIKAARKDPIEALRHE